MGVKLNPMTEVLATMGANGGLMAFINGLLQHGQEVITFEPYFPMYTDHIELAGGKLRTVPLRLIDGVWTYDPEELHKALSSKDAGIFLFNSPHNPTGKVFTKQEMEQISSMLDEFPQIKVISDEIYNFMAFDEREHHYFANIGHNWDRTVTLFSGGKLFNATGWKIGWAVGPSNIIKLGGVIQSSVFYCFNHPGQIGMANMLDKAFTKDWKTTTNEHGEQEVISYVDDIRTLFQSNRDYLSKALIDMDLPLKPVECEGGYFLMADVTDAKPLIPERFLTSHDYELPEAGDKIGTYKLNMPDDGRVPLDLAFARWMATEHGVVMMPNSLFYPPGSPNTTDNLVRMCICKERKGITAAVDKMKLVKTP